MEFFKRINIKVLSYMVTLFCAIFFMFSFYLLYNWFNMYQKEKNEKESGNIYNEVIMAPEFHSFYPLDNEIITYNAFSANKRKGVKKVISSKIGKENYSILGVVKKGKLYLVVQFEPGKKIKLVCRGERINKNDSVKKLGLNKVIIIDKMSKEREYKIFHFEDIKEIKDNDYNKKKKKEKTKKNE